MTHDKKARPFAQIVEKLRRVGLRPTRQRMALAKRLFDGPKRHVTAEILHGEVSDAEGSVSLATVYNSLHQFTDAGLLRMVEVGSGQIYFDTNLTDHHHYFMAEKGILMDVPDGVIKIDTEPAVPRGKKLSRVDVIIHVTDDD